MRTLELLPQFHSLRGPRQSHQCLGPCGGIETYSPLNVGQRIGAIVSRHLCALERGGDAYSQMCGFRIRGTFVSGVCRAHLRKYHTRNPPGTIMWVGEDRFVYATYEDDPLVFTPSSELQ